MNFKETEEKIKNYFENLDEIERLNLKMERLIDLKEKLRQKINNSDVSLENDVKSITYDDVKVHTFSIYSVQERALDKAFNDMEKQIKYIEYDIENIENIEIQISLLRKENSDIEFVIDKLNDESRTIIELIYKENKSNLRTGIIMNLDESTIRRKKRYIILDIAKFLNNLF